ncbi:MAG TPA: ATP-binding protein [Bryobacteraceae bacterium]|nr:ATP-binding protein [Bryobacteraceae bacterium]
MVDARRAFAGDPAIEVQSASSDWTRLQLSPSNEARERITAFVRSTLADLPGDLCEQLSLAVDELLGNSIEHGARADTRATIKFTLLRTARLIVFHIGDPGPGFSFDAMAHAAISNPPKEPLRHAEYRAQVGMRPGGFGIMLVKQIADELLYSEAGNEVVMIKYLENGAGHHK